MPARDVFEVRGEIFPRGHLHDGEAQTEHIRRRAGHRASHRLQGHVLRVPVLGVVGRELGEIADAKITQLQAPVRPLKHIIRLDVIVHQPYVVTMTEGQQHLHQEPPTRGLRDAPLAVPPAGEVQGATAELRLEVQLPLKNRGL